MAITLIAFCNFLQEEYAQQTGLTSAPLSSSDEQKKEVSSGL